MWYLYILRCNDGRLYTGITTDVEKRLKKHKSGKGARFTRIFGADKILYTEKQSSKGAAYKREREVKKLPRGKKMMLVNMRNLKKISQKRKAIKKKR